MTKYSLIVFLTSLVTITIMYNTTLQYINMYYKRNNLHDLNYKSNSNNVIGFSRGNLIYINNLFCFQVYDVTSLIINIIIMLSSTRYSTCTQTSPAERTPIRLPQLPDSRWRSHAPPAHAAQHPYERIPH